MLAGRESEVLYLGRELPTFAAWQFINTELPDDARVLTFARGGPVLRASAAYFLRLHHGASRCASSSNNPGAAVTGLRALGITHVLFDRDELARLDADQLAIASPAIQQACAVVYKDRRAWVCRLDYSRLSE